MSHFTFSRCATPLILVTLLACAGRTEPPKGTPLPSRALADGAPGVIVDSIAARLAELEIQRTYALAVYEPWATPVRGLDARISAYQEQLFAVSLTASAPRRVAQFVLERLDTRQAALAISHRQMLATYKADSPEVKAVAAEAAQVAQRRAELRVSLGLISESSAPN